MQGNENGLIELGLYFKKEKNRHTVKINNDIGGGERDPGN